jgi:hypothetical protein
LGRFPIRGVKKLDKSVFTKVHVENLFRENRQSTSMPVFPRFVCFIAFSGASQRWEFKNNTTKVLQKHRVEKLL